MLGPGLILPAVNHYAPFAGVLSLAVKHVQPNDGDFVPEAWEWIIDIYGTGTTL